MDIICICASISHEPWTSGNAAAVALSPFAFRAIEFMAPFLFLTFHVYIAYLTFAFRLVVASTMQSIANATFVIFIDVAIQVQWKMKMKSKNINFDFGALVNY